MKDIWKIKKGDRFDLYHDGKISPSRLSILEVDCVLKRGEVSKKYLRMWKKAIIEDFNEMMGGHIFYADGGPNQFFDWNCEEFIFGRIAGEDWAKGSKDQIMFARVPHKRGWYGVNWNYRLDLEGKFRKEYEPTWRQAAAECGQTMHWNEETLQYEYTDIGKEKKDE